MSGDVEHAAWREVEENCANAPEFINGVHVVAGLDGSSMSEKVSDQRLSDGLAPTVGDGPAAVMGVGGKCESGCRGGQGWLRQDGVRHHAGEHGGCNITVERDIP